MPKLETEEEAEKIMSERAKSSSSEFDKKRIEQRQKDAFKKKVKQIKNGQKKKINHQDQNQKQKEKD